MAAATTTGRAFGGRIRQAAVSLACRAIWLLLAGCLWLTGGSSARGADWQEGRRELLHGQYSRCIELAQGALKGQGARDAEEWQLLLSQALMETGRYPEARVVITNALAQDRWNVRLCWQGQAVYRANGLTNEARELIEGIIERVSRHPADYRDVPSLVAFSQAALRAGADPKRVLDTVLEGAKKADPKSREVYLAVGNLALEKHDYELAAKRFAEGLKQLPEDPDLHFGLARAFASSESSLAMSSLERTLELNSNHVASLLLLVDHNVDAEDYAGASKLLDRIERINPWHPDAWAYKAVLAHLRQQPDAEKEARDKALKYWPMNPRVDHLMGLKLSQHYRFAEGAEHQRQALAFDPNDLAAKGQLAQDLLRLGDEAEGWRLADEVQQKDGYDVGAYNLTTLHDTMGKFATLTNADFVLRMSPREAALYGTRVLDLLSRVRKQLVDKYGASLRRPTVVEVFPEQKDFAVRTFGMPGNPGFLGVCFGNVITANSPASQGGHPVNWEAVLWHEFCHVVTLQMTHNKMPRWLSEGISVHEELCANPAWGQRMTPRYREMVLDGELTPISKLSGAFLAPRTPEHLQFAYYESALVVEFISQRFGLGALKQLLIDLGTGMEINQALEKNTLAMATLEKDFAGFARQRAEQLAPGLDWEKPEEPVPGLDLAASLSLTNLGRHTGDPVGPARRPLDPEAMVAWVAARPTNYYALKERAAEFVGARKFEEAKAPLKKLIELYPGQNGGDSAYALLAATHRALGETNQERQVLAQFVLQDDAAPEACQRLMELGAGAGDWPAVLENARRYLAVNPLVAPPYRFLAQASEHTGDTPAAIEAYRGWLQLDPADPAEVHFRLAQALHRQGDPGAKRQVLEALEEAPRYRAALELLVELNRQATPKPAAAPPAARDGERKMTF